MTARWRLRASLGLLASGLVGCAGVTPSRSSGVAPAAIAHAYEQGVHDAHAQLAAERGADPHAAWTVPVLQEVWIPAHVVRGVFLPGHREWVVIHPAAWQRGSRTAEDPGPVRTPEPDRSAP
jgi:hypothetical protein